MANHRLMSPRGAGLAVSGLVVTATAAIAGGGVLPSLLWPALFGLGLSVGSMGLMLVNRLTGGAWGELLSPALGAAAAVLPLTALLLAPVLLGLHSVYPWAGAHVLPEAGSWWLNTPFFVVRTLLYAACWLVLARMLGALGDSGSPGPSQARSGVGLILSVATTSLAAFDWVMSLDPLWYSTALGLLVCAASAAAALALAVLWRLGTQGQGPPPPARLHDLGNLLFACLLLWTYLVFMQFLTVWIANLPGEIRWFLPRMDTGWRWLGIAVLALQLLLALPLLLSRAAKRAPRTLGLAAGLILCAQALYVLWLTLPTLRPRAPGIRAADLGLFLGLGEIWLAAFLARLHRQAPARAAARSEP
jgi:hypothetical protein